jgi:drug/metabolite transporter (DMT)-like permease
VTTVVLAVAILHEQLARWHLAGLAMAAGTIVLTTAGGA